MRILTCAAVIGSAVLVAACGAVGPRTGATEAAGLVGAPRPSAARSVAGSAGSAGGTPARASGAPPLASLAPCQLLTLAEAQSLGQGQLTRNQPSQNPALGVLDCAYQGGRVTVGLHIQQSPPPGSNYAQQLAEARYVVTAKTCPFAAYHELTGLGDAAFSSYCTTGSYNANNDQVVTWTDGDLILSVFILGDSSSRNWLPGLTAIAMKVNSRL